MDRIKVESESLLDNYGFTQLDNVVLMSPKLPNHSKILYVHLKHFYYKATQAYDLGIDKSFYISREELSKLMQMSASNLDSYMKPLKDIGLVRVKSQGIGKPNVYILPEITEDILIKLEPNIRKFKVKYGSPNTVNDSKMSTETGSPNTVNDRILSRTSEDTVKDPAEYGHQYNTKDKKINNTIQTEHSNMSKQQNSLFDIPKGSSLDAKSPLEVLKALKGKSLLIKKIQFVLSGQLDHSHLTDLDLCYYYAEKHREIVGYEIPYRKDNYMQMFRDKYNLSKKEAFELIPRILETFKQMCESEKRKKSEWNLKIGLLSWDGSDTDIAKIMAKVKPKVNEKYLDAEQQRNSNKNTGGLVDEVF